MTDNDDPIEQVRKILEKSGIPSRTVDEWINDPKAAVENQKTQILLMIKDKILDLTNQVNQLQINVIEMQKQITELNAWKWRQERK